MGKDIRPRSRGFVGSSRESRRVAYSVQQNLGEHADVTVWDQNVLNKNMSRLVKQKAGSNHLINDEVRKVMNPGSLCKQLLCLLWLGTLLGLPNALKAAPKISGKVIDAAGHGLGGVIVQMRNTADSKITRVLTADDGKFEISSLQPGTYVLSTTVAGFKPFTKENIVLQADTQEEADIPLIRRNLPKVSGKVIDGAGHGLAGVIVQMRNTADTKIACVLSDEDGKYEISSLPQGTYVLSTGGAGYKSFSKEDIVLEAGTEDEVNVSLEHGYSSWGEFSRVIAGFEQAGASSAESVQKFFFDLAIDIPFPYQRKGKDPHGPSGQRTRKGEKGPYSDFGPRLRLWGNTRITTAPQQITTSIAEFASTLPTQISKINVNEVAQSAEFLAGLEFRLFGTHQLFPSFDRQTKNRFSFSLMAGAGVISPLTPRQSLDVFKATDEAKAFYLKTVGENFPAGKDFIGFVLPERDRFFRHYYGGFRLKTHYFNNCEVPIQRYPATLDITYGVNESVTGGRFHGGVFRLEGFYPLPYDSLKYIYLFGTALFKPARANIVAPLLLPKPDASQKDQASNPANVAIITVPQINRDYYRIGVGIDFVAVVKAIKDRPAGQ